jgi:hypothetical protein
VLGIADDAMRARRRDGGEEVGTLARPRARCLAFCSRAVRIELSRVGVASARIRSGASPVAASRLSTYGGTKQWIGLRQ